jgi:subtilisin family serine protease
MAYPSDEIGPAAKPKPRYAPGVLIVKFKEPVADQLKAGLVRGDELHKVSTTPSLDALAARYGVKGTRMLFPGFEVRDASGMVVGFETARDHAERIHRKFPNRAAGAVPAEVPDLTMFFRLELAPDADVRQAVAEYEAEPEVERAQPNYLYDFWWEPNDHYYGSSNSWNQGYRDQWGVIMIQCASAWERSKGAGVVVAVVDTGVDYNHEDISGNIWTNQDEIPGNGVDDDGNGYIDDVRGWNFADPNDPGKRNNPMDGFGHGTHCAGIVGAMANNGPNGDTGVVGVAPEAKVMALRAASQWAADFPGAVHYAADNGASVLSCSWGGYGYYNRDYALEAALQQAHALGCVLVFAAGNDNRDVTYYSPQFMAETVVVAATDHLDARSAFSNWGWQVDVAAPGGDDRTGQNMWGQDVLSLKADAIFSPNVCIVGDGRWKYYRAAGSSMACPFVSGLAALIRSRHPEFTNEQVRQVIRLSADDKGTAGKDDFFGYGRINAGTALQIESVCTAHIFYPHNGDWQSKKYYGYVDIYGTASGPGFANWKLEYANKHMRAQWAQFASGTTPVTNWYLGRFNFSNLPDGRYIVRLTVTDTLARKFQFEVQVMVVLGLYNCSGGGYDVTISSAPATADLLPSYSGQEMTVTLESRGLLCLRADGSKAWSWYSCPPFSSSPSLADVDSSHAGLEVVVGSDDGYLSVFHGDNGTVYWSRQMGSAVKSPAIADIDPGRTGLEIACVSQAGYLHLVTQYNEVLWSRYLGTGVAGPVVAELDLDRTTPGLEMAAIGGGNLHIIRSDRSVYRQIQIPGGALRCPAVADLDPDHVGQEIAVGSNAGTLYILYPDGTVWRQFDGQGQITSACPVVADFVPSREGLEVAVGRNDGYLYVYSARDNCLCWRFYAGSSVLSCPAVGDLDTSYPGPEVAFRADEGKVYVLHGSDGSLFWGFDTNWAHGPPSPSPIIADVDPGCAGLEMVLGSEDGLLYVMNFRATCSTGAAPWPMYAHDPAHTSLFPKAVYVDASNLTGIEYGTLFHPYNTVEEGIALASASYGSTVKVARGTYSPSGGWYQLPGYLTLEGSTILDSDELLVNAYAQTFVTNGGVYCANPSITVRNLTLQAGTYAGVWGGYSGPGNGATNLRIEGCVVSGTNYWYSVYLLGNSGNMNDSVASFTPLVRHNQLCNSGYGRVMALYCHPTITSNRITQPSSCPPIAVYYGEADITANYIQGLQGQYGSDGIRVYLCVTANIDGNQIMYNARGIYSWAYYDAGNPNNQCITQWLAGRRCTTNVRNNLFGYNDLWDAYLTDNTTGQVYGNDTLTPPLKMYLH